MKNTPWIQRAAALLLTLLAPVAAHAQDFAPITTMFQTVAAALTGPVGLAVTTIAVIVAGYLCFMGRLNMVFFVSVLIGAVMVFGASDIVAGFS